MNGNHKLISLRRYLINNLLAILPVFKFYRLKNVWLNQAGIKANNGAKINGRTIFYGRGFISIGIETWIGPECRFYSDEKASIIIGDHCDIAPEVSFLTGSHEISGPSRRAGLGTAKDIVIGKGCWIGARTTILGGVTIGNSSIIAAGALVNKSIPSNCIAAGVPAKVIKHIANA